MKAPSERGPSIADVARRAGVSATTVSHVVSGKRPVNGRTAASVRRVMRELGYVPNQRAQSLRLGMSRTLGLVVPDISNPYFAELAKGAADAGEQRGFNLVLTNTGFGAAREARYLDVLRGGGIDGMVYAAGAPPSRGRLAELVRVFHVVVVDEELPEVSADTVVSDHEGGGRLAGEHLLELGHRRILTITGPDELDSSRRRARGFASAFEGVEARLESVPGDYRPDSAVSAIRAELDGGLPWFTAVFAANDLMALAAIEALTDRGYRVPEDVSVLGYDDIALAALVYPSLTTVRQPVYRMGWVAADRLVGSLMGEGSPEAIKVVLDVELVVRGSSASPRSQEVRT